MPDLLLGNSESDLRAIGDRMQSESSRLLEWVSQVRTEHSTTLEMPYEVQMTAAGLRFAIDDWTDARRAEARR